jgi:hypothetical protein
MNSVITVTRLVPRRLDVGITKGNRRRALAAEWGRCEGPPLFFRRG